MDFLTLFAILAVIAGLSESSRLDSIDENINDNRIIGGSTARPGQFPYMASLRVKRNVNGTFVWRHQCGGSILNNRWILSAAHCTQRSSSNTSNVAVALGAHHSYNDGQIYRLDRIINHSMFNRVNLHNDICLLRTKEKIQFTDFVKPIRLRRQFVGDGIASTVSGWGFSQWGGPAGAVSPTHLQYLRVNTITNDACRRSRPSFNRFVYDGSICTFARKGQGICNRDSGSALALNGQLIGVPTWALHCARGVPDGYTRISAFVKWIQEISGVVAV